MELKDKFVLRSLVCCLTRWSKVQSKLLSVVRLNFMVRVRRKVSRTRPLSMLLLQVKWRDKNLCMGRSNKCRGNEENRTYPYNEWLRPDRYRLSRHCWTPIKFSFSRRSIHAVKVDGRWLRYSITRVLNFSIRKVSVNCIHRKHPNGTYNKTQSYHFSDFESWPQNNIDSVTLDKESCYKYINYFISFCDWNVIFFIQLLLSFILKNLE